VSDQDVGPSAAPASGTKVVNKKATYALVGGILGITFCGVILGILAIITGKQAQAEIAASGGLEGGENRAKWGIILGWVSVAYTVLVAIIVFATFAGS
jgi:ABC-type antimicrobial peptide transport system permease subunit